MIKCTCEASETCTCPNSLVCLKHLWFRRGDQIVLEDITLCLDEGVFLGLIGPNGGGKTTLLKLIIGLLPPTAGQLLVFGRRPLELGDFRQRIGYVPQRPQIDRLFPATALDVVLMGAVQQMGPLPWFTQSWRHRAQQALERVGAADLANRPIGQMSGGQQQRVFLARALITQPRLLVLDEPTSGLDSHGQQQFLHLLRDLRNDLGLTIIMVSHDVGQLGFYADQIACLNRRLHWHDKAELLTQPVVEHVYTCELDAYVERVREISN